MVKENEYKELDAAKMGQRIRSQREFLKMTREELGKKLGVTGKFISDLEFGLKGISIKKLYRLAQILGVSTDYILVGKMYNDEEDSERVLLEEGILEPLKRCSIKQLKYMEGITKLYVEALKENEKQYN